MADDVGRLVKKKSLEEKGYLDIQEYPWLDFVEDGILFTDNPRKSVVHTRFHTSEEIAEKVRAPQNFDRPMGPKSRILVPTDLTEEYQRSQQEIFLRKRKRMLDEDELFNLELADLNGQGSEVEGAWSKRGTPAEAAPVAPTPREQAASSPREQAASSPREQAASSPREQAASSPREQAASSPRDATSSPRDATSDMIAHMTSHVAPNVAVATAGNAALREATLESRRETPESHPAPEPDTPADFAQGHAEGLAQGLAQGLAEGAARGEAEGFAQGHAEGLEQGRQAGFQEGFTDGEAKGVAAAEARTERYFSLLAEALAELETLRGEVLRAGQDIFLEIANLCCEKILRQKLASSDDALRKLFLSAVDAYADAHRVTLEMSPSDAARMKGAFEAGIQARVAIRENPDLAPGDFRADSDKEILTVDLKRAVEGLIENLRGELFPEDAGVAAPDAAGGSSPAVDKARKTG